MRHCCCPLPGGAALTLAAHANTQIIKGASLLPQVLLLSDEMRLDEVLSLLCILAVRDEVGRPDTRGLAGSVAPVCTGASSDPAR